MVQKRARILLQTLTKGKGRTVVVAIVAGLAISAILNSFRMPYFESYLYDLRMRMRGTTANHEHITLVSIDDKTLARLNEFPPLSLKQHATIIKRLATFQPKAVAYLVNFNEVLPAESMQDQSTIQEAESFVELAASISKQGTELWLGTDIDVTGEVVAPFPLSKIPHRISTIHKDGTVFAEDKVTRRALFSAFGEQTLHAELARLINGKKTAEEYRNIYPMTDIDAKYFFINYSGPTQEGKHPFEEISAIDLLDGKVDASKLKDRIVLVGTKSTDDTYDYILTPYSRSAFSNSKLVAHANIIETLIHDNTIKRSARSLNFVITFLLTALITWIVFQTSPIEGVFATTLCGLFVIAAGLILFRTSNLWLILWRPLMGVFLAYYIFVPYRLITEYKSRWQFQRKNEVLEQVEELKSNFMNLITHDLKTPVARIQGMAEMLARTGTDPKVIGEILNSTEELNRFISSILELATIENNKTILDKRSKDVNKVIKEAIKKLEFHAKGKNITIDTKLEPLFPIPLDSSLISKVISNIIDNAIKYSPENAKITVESKESEIMVGFVEIHIADTGHGISRTDLENLFTKFYRSRNDVTMKTKGTGLGLYLSRYFVELHLGSLTVHSEEGKGSLFSILLPMDEKTPDLSVTPRKGEVAHA